VEWDLVAGLVIFLVKAKNLDCMKVVDVLDCIEEKDEEVDVVHLKFTGFG
jgi:hypothetical protein